MAGSTFTPIGSCDGSGRGCLVIPLINPLNTCRCFCGFNPELRSGLILGTAAGRGILERAFTWLVTSTTGIWVPLLDGVLIVRSAPTPPADAAPKISPADLPKALDSLS